MTTEERWVEAGYNLFAHEGPEGLQVERLARILNLNKSGFYHYFGDTESYFKQLKNYHYGKCEHFLKDVANCQNIDPEYLNILIKHKVSVLAQVQMVRNQIHPLLYGAHKELDEKVGQAILRIWAEYTELSNNLDLALTYYTIVRDMFYSRINHENFNYNYLSQLADETRSIVVKIFLEKNSLADKDWM